MLIRSTSTGQTNNGYGNGDNEAYFGQIEHDDDHHMIREGRLQIVPALKDSLEHDFAFKRNKDAYSLPPSLCPQLGYITVGIKKEVGKILVVKDTLKSEINRVTHA